MFRETQYPYQKYKILPCIFYANNISILALTSSILSLINTKNRQITYLVQNAQLSSIYYKYSTPLMMRKS